MNIRGVAYVFVKWEEMAGLHDASSDKLKDKFTVNKVAMDIYNHIDHDDLRKSYFGCIPQLGIM